MSKTAVFYGSDTGNTEAAAKKIAVKLNADIFYVGNNPIDKIAEYSTSWRVAESSIAANCRCNFNRI